MMNKQFKVGDLVEAWTVTKGENIGVIFDTATLGGPRGHRVYSVRFPTRQGYNVFHYKHLNLLTNKKNKNNILS